MSEKKLFIALVIILALSIGLLAYAKIHVGSNFINQL